MAILQIIDFIFHNTATAVAFIIAMALLVQLIVRSVFEQVARRVIRRHKFSSSLDEKKRKDTLAGVFKTLATVVVWTIALFSVLAVLHIDIAALLTGAGLIGIIVGFGAQNTIKDILAGIFIISENQYRVGDIVTLNAGGREVSGVVEDLTVRITRLRDLDGNLHIVKNGSAEVVTNRSYRYANVNINLDVSYSADIDQVEEVINQVGKEMIKEGAPLKEHIYEPIAFLRVDSFESSSVRIKALGKVEPAKQWEVSGAFLRRIKTAFAKNGIEIPYTHVVVHKPKA